MMVRLRTIVKSNRIGYAEKWTNKKNVRSVEFNFWKARNLFGHIVMYILIAWCLNVSLNLCNVKQRHSSLHIYVRTLITASTQHEILMRDTVVYAWLCVCVREHFSHTFPLLIRITSDRLYVRFSFFPNERSADSV